MPAQNIENYMAPEHINNNTNILSRKMMMMKKTKKTWWVNIKWWHSIKFLNEAQTMNASLRRKQRRQRFVGGVRKMEILSRAKISKRYHHKWTENWKFHTELGYGIRRCMRHTNVFLISKWERIVSYDNVRCFFRNVCVFGKLISNCNRDSYTTGSNCACKTFSLFHEKRKVERGGDCDRNGELNGVTCGNRQVFQLQKF